VISYEVDPPTAVVLSGWGNRSQWYRNLQAAPPVAISIGDERWLNPAFEVLEPERGVEFVERYRHDHPLLMWSLDRFFGWPRKASDEERRALERELCIGEFRPGDG